MLDVQLDPTDMISIDVEPDTPLDIDIEAVRVIDPNAPIHDDLSDLLRLTQYWLVYGE